MSYSLFMLRLLTVETLKNQTYAGARVLDAPLDPLSILDVEAKPLIAVYTSECKGNIHGHDLMGADLSAEIIMQILLPTCVNIDDLEIEVRESGAAALHDMISGQILRALQTSQSEAADLWREFALPLGSQENFSLYLSPIVFSLSEGLRFPAYEVRISLRPLSDPLPFMELPELWQRAFTLMGQNPDLAPLAKCVEHGMLDQTSDHSDAIDWLKTIQALGLSKLQGQAVGFGE